MLKYSDSLVGPISNYIKLILARESLAIWVSTAALVFVMTYASQLLGSYVTILCN